MPARRRVSLRQVELLLDFVESHRDVALGRFPGGPQAAQSSRAVWKSVALRLNSIADGATRSADQWRRYWIELKAKTKCKAADVRRSAVATGGGPSKLVPLTELEERLLAIIGPVQPPSADIQPAEIQSARVNRLGHAQPSTGPIRRARLSRQFPADERAPQWAYEIESRRVAAEESQAAAVESLMKAVQEQTRAVQEQTRAVQEHTKAVTQGLQEMARQQANSTEALVNILRAMNQR